MRSLEQLSAENEKMRGIIARNSLHRLRGEETEMYVTVDDIKESLAILNDRERGLVGLLDDMLANAQTLEQAIAQVKLAIVRTDVKIAHMENALEAMLEKQTARRCEIVRQETLARHPNAEVSEGGTRDSQIETAAQSRPSLH